MPVSHYYLLTYLPTLRALGEPTEITGPELLAQLGDAPRAKRLVEAIYLSDDLLQRDTLLAGKDFVPQPTVLTMEQMRGEDPLPEALALAGNPSGDTTGRAVVDSVWGHYFYYVADVAKQNASPFLAAWVGYEVTLRNALAESRARALDLDAADYLIAADVASDEDVSATLATLAAASSATQNPMQLQQALDSARASWLDQNGPYFSFGDDELLAYAAKLMLAERWARLAEAIEAQEKQA
jgi:hypothetical protein